MKMILLAVACLQAGTVSAAPESCKDELTAPARANLGTLKVKLASCSDRYELFVFRDKKGQPEKIDNVRVAAPKANQRWVFDGRRCALAGVGDAKAVNKAVLVSENSGKQEIAEIWTLDKRNKWMKQNPSTTTCPKF